MGQSLGTEEGNDQPRNWLRGGQNGWGRFLNLPTNKKMTYAEVATRVVATSRE